MTEVRVVLLVSNRSLLVSYAGRSFVCDAAVVVERYLFADKT